MESEQTNQPQKKEEDISNKESSSVPKNPDQGEGDKENSGKSHTYPFRVKIDEDKGWKRTEIIEIIGIIIGIIVLVVTFITFRQTKRSVDISAQALSDSRKKDSIAEIRSEIENRPIIQISDFKIESLGEGDLTIIRFNIINIGRFPAIVLSGRHRFLYGGPMNAEEIEKAEPGEEAILNNSVFATTVLPYTITENPLPGNIINQYKEGKLFLYLFAEFKYVSLATKKRYSYTFIYKMGDKPQFNIIGLKNEDNPLP